MSEETVQYVVTLAMWNLGFRELLFSFLEKALEGYELTVKEAEFLKQLDRESFDKEGELEKQLTRFGINMRS